MTKFQKLGACSVVALMVAGTLSGCCGSKCGLGGCGLSRAATQVSSPVIASGCDSCDQAAIAQQSFSQPTFAQPQTSFQQQQPVFSSGAPVSAGSGTISAPQFNTPTFGGGSGTSAPIFNGGGSGTR